MIFLTRNNSKNKNKIWEYTLVTCTNSNKYQVTFSSKGFIMQVKWYFSRLISNPTVSVTFMILLSVPQKLSNSRSIPGLIVQSSTFFVAGIKVHRMPGFSGRLLFTVSRVKRFQCCNLVDLVWYLVYLCYQFFINGMYEFFSTILWFDDNLFTRYRDSISNN